MSGIFIFQHGQVPGKLAKVSSKYLVGKSVPCQPAKPVVQLGSNFSLGTVSIINIRNLRGLPSS